jgi:hypothetical protein
MNTCDLTPCLVSSGFAIIDRTVNFLHKCMNVYQLNRLKLDVKVFISHLKSNPPNTYQEVGTKTMQVHIAQPLDSRYSACLSCNKQPRNFDSQCLQCKCYKL